MKLSVGGCISDRDHEEKEEDGKKRRRSPFDGMDQKHKAEGEKYTLRAD